jgi:hypothetical protein
MTEKQLQILGLQVELCRRLMRHETFGDTTPKRMADLAQATQTHRTAMRRLIEQGYVVRLSLSTRTKLYGYILTDAGLEWYNENNDLHKRLRGDDARDE